MLNAGRSMTLPKRIGTRDICGGIVCDPDAPPKLGAAVRTAEHAGQSAAQPAARRESTDQKSVAQNRPDWRELVSGRWHEIVSIVVELAGIGVLSAGFWLIRPWCGLIVSGMGLIVIGFANSPRFDKHKQSR